MIKKIFILALMTFFFTKVGYNSLTSKESMLFDYASSGNVDGIETLLSERVDVNAVDDDGYTPLHRAILNGELEVVKALLSFYKTNKEARLPNDAQIDNWYLSGATPLILASYLGDIEIVKALLDAGANIKARDRVDKALPIHIAAAKGHTEIVEYFLTQDKNLIKIKDKHNNTALHWASVKNNSSTVLALVENGADAKSTNSMGFSSSNYASFLSNNTLILALSGYVASTYDGEEEILLSPEITNNMTVEEIDTVQMDNIDKLEFILAIKNGDIIIIEKGIKNGIDPNFLDEDGYTPLHRAIIYNKIESVTALLETADVNKMCKSFSFEDFEFDAISPLHLASALGYTDIAIELIKSGANINELDSKYGMHAIHIASINGDAELIEELINIDSNIINYTYGDSITPIYLAIEYDRSEALEVLLYYGADANKIFSNNFSYLHKVAGSKTDDTDLVDTLFLQYRISLIDIKDDISGNTPLHIAGLSGNVNIAIDLVNRGAYINSFNNNKYTPLHYAVESGNLNMVKELVYLGANRYIVSSNGTTPYDISVTNSFHDISYFLIEKQPSNRNNTKWWNGLF